MKAAYFEKFYLDLWEHEYPYCSQPSNLYEFIEGMLWIAEEFIRQHSTTFRIADRVFVPYEEREDIVQFSEQASELAKTLTLLHEDMEDILLSGYYVPRKYRRLLLFYRDKVLSFHKKWDKALRFLDSSMVLLSNISLYTGVANRNFVPVSAHSVVKENRVLMKRN